MPHAPIELRPLSPERWEDLAALFGANGAYANCWCMWWRTTSAGFSAGLRGGNKRAFRDLVRRDRVPGIIAYDGGVPAGWCSVAPRAEFGRLDRSPALKPVDDEEVWSIVCFYIPRANRRRGIGAALLRGAVEHARAGGARIVEGYPVGAEPRPADASAYTGLDTMFEAAGFTKVAQRKGKRSIWRYRITPAGRRRPAV
jgi:GNAT superfamily N-acetyltransferase